jgi:hypothetical protein
MTASLGIRLTGTNSDPRPKTKRSNEIQVRRSSPRAATNDQLVLQQQGLGHDGAYSTRAQNLGNSGQQVDGEYE